MILSQLRGVLVFTELASTLATPPSLDVKSPSLEVEPLAFTGLPVIPDKATCGEWATWAPPRTYPAVVMQVVSEYYVDQLRNFITLMERNSVFTRHHMYLVCIDDSSVPIVASLGIRCVPLGALRRSRTRPGVWRTRIIILSCLVTQGYDVIMSDADALWLRDPIEYFNLPSVRSSSVVASRGVHPTPLTKKWGTALCMGFIMFRATGPGMDELQKSIEALVLEDGDDQVATNQALYRLGVVWDEDSDMRLTGSTDFGRGTIEKLRGDDGPFVVTLLPHSVFTRQCSRVPISNKTVVAHCYQGKSPDNPMRISWMQKANLWFVDSKDP